MIFFQKIASILLLYKNRGPTELVHNRGVSGGEGILSIMIGERVLILGAIRVFRYGI